MRRAQLLLHAALLLTACEGRAPHAAPTRAEAPAQRTFSIWQDDSIRFYYPEPGRGMVEVRDVDRVPARWRELVVVEFKGDDASGYYVADLRADPRDEAVASLISAEQLNARAAALAAAYEAVEQPPEAPAPPEAPEVPEVAEAPRAGKPSEERRAPEAPSGIIIEGLSRATGPAPRPMQLGGFDANSAGISAGERARWIAEVFGEVNGARRRGAGCQGVKPSRELVRSEPLDRAAQAVALDMARTGNTLREDVRVEVKASGYRGQTQGITAEGVHSGRAFATKYLEDQARCRWLLSDGFKALGVGTARSKSGHYWVMILGSNG